MIPDVPEQAQQAFIALQKKERRGAHDLLTQVVKENPHDERFWLWLSWAAENEDEHHECMEKLRAINPDNPVVKRYFEGAQSVSSPSPIEPSSAVAMTYVQHLQQHESSARAAEPQPVVATPPPPPPPDTHADTRPEKPTTTEKDAAVGHTSPQPTAGQVADNEPAPPPPVLEKAVGTTEIAGESMAEKQPPPKGEKGEARVPTPPAGSADTGETQNETKQDTPAPPPPPAPAAGDGGTVTPTDRTDTTDTTDTTSATSTSLSPPSPPPPEPVELPPMSFILNTGESASPPPPPSPPPAPVELPPMSFVLGAGGDGSTPAPVTLQKTEATPPLPPPPPPPALSVEKPRPAPPDPLEAATRAYNEEVEQQVFTMTLSLPDFRDIKRLFSRSGLILLSIAIFLLISFLAVWFLTSPDATQQKTVPSTPTPIVQSLHSHDLDNDRDRNLWA